MKDKRWIIIPIIILAFIASWCSQQPVERQALPTATLSNWPPTYDATKGWDWCHQRGDFPAGYYQHKEIVREGILCNLNGHYVGPCDCDYNYVMVLNDLGTPIATYSITPQNGTAIPITSTWTATITQTATPTKTATVTPSRTATSTFTKTPTSTPTPSLDCVEILWDRGLNMGNIPSMFNRTVGGYLTKGMIFKPLDTHTSWEGIFVKFGQDWWVAMDLTWNNNVYAKLVDCP